MGKVSLVVLHGRAGKRRDRALAAILVVLAFLAAAKLKDTPLSRSDSLRDYSSDSGKSATDSHPSCSGVN